VCCSILILLEFDWEYSPRFLSHDVNKTCLSNHFVLIPPSIIQNACKIMEKVEIILLDTIRKNDNLSFVVFSTLTSSYCTENYISYTKFDTLFLAVASSETMSWRRIFSDRKSIFLYFVAIWGQRLPWGAGLEPTTLRFPASYLGDVPR